MNTLCRHAPTCGTRPSDGGSSRRWGFTLLELMAVLVILGLLAMVAATKYGQLQTSAERAALQALMGAAISQCAIEHADLSMNPDHSTFGLTPAGVADQAKKHLAFDSGKFDTPVFTPTSTGITISVAFASGQGSATITDKTWELP